ncbi:MAG: sensor histidine kinase [Anaerolineae bacterium]|nr:sensor histidine kinase [Anaerolineae bacterium]
MATTPANSFLINLPKRVWQGLLAFFSRLQWKLTFAYALSTVATTVVLSAIGLGLMWYLNFWSNWLPNLIAESLLKVTSVLVPYLEQSPPDRAGLNGWLHNVIADDNLVINIPTDEGQPDSKLPGNFGPVVLMAVVDRQGRVLAEYPAETTPPEALLRTQIPAEAHANLEAALRGETEPGTLAQRTANNHIFVAVPIMQADQQLLGALFVELTYPIEESEFLWLVLQQTILPVGGAMLVVGLIAGTVFGFFIARSLTRRLRRLAGATDAWSKGNFEVLIQDSSADELSQLARQLNHMALQLQNLLQTRQELATLEERNRLARDLHDSVKQQIFATAMQVGAARALLAQQPDTAQTHLLEAERLVHEAQQELTTLIRELRPAALEGYGLAAALRNYTADWSRQNQISVEVRVQGERPLPLVVEQTLFRVAQEALANVSRHSAATAAEVHLACTAHQVNLTISDNGQGFDPATTNGKGLGLRSMRERVEALGGELVIESESQRGTRIAAKVTTA